jgi:hypothetical protein
MSKIGTLRSKYNTPQKTFDRFVEADFTSTKKYLEYMLKIWAQDSRKVGTISNLIEYVHKFNELLPYIPLKDIYHHEYHDFHFLIAMVERAEEVKEEKTFVREEHCDVLIDCENYMLLRPKTFKGSLKYGANTKWCTASKNNESTFTRYFSNGYLAYLISKDKDIDPNLSKIAFYSDYTSSSLSGEISVYDSLDKSTDDFKLIKNGWKENDIFEIISTVRFHTMKNKQLKDSFNFISKLKESIEKLNFNDLRTHIDIINNNYDTGYLDDIKETINKFKEKLIQYGN